MTDDTDWLKKNPVGNPFRMSRRRSSRFYTQDMDASIMTNEENPKNQVLAISHVPRKSNLPINKIKEMNLKIPAPLQRKSAIKKPVTRVTKFSVGQPSVSRPSSCFRTNPNTENFLKPSTRQSGFCRPNVGRAYFLNGTMTKIKMAQSATDFPLERSGSSFRGYGDISILLPSRIANQSTPREPSVLRSILKQKENSQRICNRKVLDSKEPKAAKRVNFNGDAKGNSPEKEMGGTPLKRGGSFSSASEADTCQELKKDLLAETDDESTVAFSSSFKPISYDEVRREEKEETVKNELDLTICGEQEDDTCRKKTHVSAECSRNTDSSDSNSVISNIMDMWKVYWSEVNNIRTRLRSLEDSFEKTLNFVMDDTVREQFSVYQTEKGRLYEKLQCVELEFSDNVKSNVNVKTLFSNYSKKKELIFKEQSELEENFGKTLGTIAQKHLDEKTVMINDATECDENEEVLSKKVLSKKLKIDRPKWGSIKRVSGGKRKSGSVNGLQMKALPRTGSPKETTDSANKTPDNAPASLVKLSRKVENQIKVLFEE